MPAVFLAGGDVQPWRDDDPCEFWDVICGAERIDCGLNVVRGCNCGVPIKNCREERLENKEHTEMELLPRLGGGNDRICLFDEGLPV